MKKKVKAVQSVLGIVLAIATGISTMPLSALAVSPQSDESEYVYIADDETGGGFVTSDQNIEVTKELDIDELKATEDPDWHRDPYPLDILIVEPDPELTYDDVPVPEEFVEDENAEDIYEETSDFENSDFENPDGDLIEETYEEEIQDLEIIDPEEEYEEEELYASWDAVSGDYTYSLSKDKATITGYSGEDEDVVIPDLLDDYPVVGIGSNVFKNKSSIKTITLPSTLTSIGSYAFQNCTELEEITIPSGVTSISGSAFNNSVKKIIFAEGTTAIVNNACYNASNLETVVIPDTVTKLGNNAFYQCRKLVSVTLPDALTEIGSSAFQYCEALDSIALPEGLGTIGANAFNNAKALTEITIPATVTSIGSSAFNNSVSKVIFAAGTTKIPNNACNGASALTTVVIPETVTEIGNSAFYNCKKLQSADLPDSLLKIGSSAFYQCESLTGIELPEGLTEIGSSVFSNAKLITEITIPVSLTIIGNGAFNNAVKKIIFAEGTTKIPDGACKEDYLLEKVVIPSTVTEVGKNAFYGCKNLEAFSLPNSITTIGNNAFYNCNLWTEVTIPSNIASIGQNNFNYAIKIVFADGTTAVPNNACYGAAALEVVEMPDSVTSIGEAAFYNCKKLTGFAFSNNVTSIGKNAFGYCSALTDLTIPSNITSIGDNAFYNSVKTLTFADGTKDVPQRACYGANLLESVVFPDSVENIGGFAFYQCKKITTVSLPKNLSTIGEKAFYQCTLLETVEFTGSVESIGNSAFYGCTSLKAMALPEGLENIYNSAFYNCSALDSVLIPKSIKTVGQSVFYGSAKGIIFANGIKDIPAHVCDGASLLKEVSIPSGVETIGERAFYGCTLLEKVELPDGVKSVGKSAFYGDNGLKIYVPDSLTEIGDQAFAGCTIARKCGEGTEWEIDLEENAATITGEGEIGNDKGNVFGSFADSVEYIEIDAGITELTDHSFEDMDSLVGVVVGDNVKEIGAQAFEGCESLERVELSKDLETIEEKAFNGCEAVDTVIFTGNFPQIDDTALPNQSFTAYYPKSVDGFLDNATEKYNYITWRAWDDTLPPRDVVLVLDVSGSMSGNRIANLKTAVCEFAEKVGGRVSNTRIGIITYDSDARRIMPFSTDVMRMKGNTKRMTAGGGTVYLNAFAEAQKLIDESTANVMSVIMFSDGDPSDNRNSIRAKAEEFRDAGYYMYSVGLSPSDNNRQLLIDIAGGEENYFEADDIEALISKFVEISQDMGRSGSCGDNVKWKYNEKNNQLIISVDKNLDGEGKMQDFIDESPAWDAYSDAIRRITIEGNVTYIGKNAFTGLSNVTNVQIGKELKEIGAGAFGNSSKLKNVYYLGEEKDWKKITIGADNNALLNANISYGTKDPDQPTNKVTGVVMKPANATLTVGDNEYLYAEVVPKTATNKGVTWSSSDTKIATVSSSGKVKALDVGTATITAMTKDGGYKATCNVTVTNTIPVINSLTLGGSSGGIKVDDNIPFFGGKTFNVSLPVSLPVSAVLEDKSLKIGINIKKSNLYSYNSTEGVTTTTYKKKSIKEQFEEFKQDAYKSKLMAKDKDWLKNVQDQKFLEANIPGVEKAVTLNCVGYVEGAWADNFQGMEKIEGSVVFVLSAEATAQTQVVVLFVPVTVNCTISGSGKLIAAVGYDFTKATWYGDLKLAASLGLEPYAGIGFGQWFSGGVYGNGTTDFAINVLSTNKPLGLQTWSVSGEIGLKGYIAKKSANLAILSGSHVIYDKSRKKSSSGYEGDINALRLDSVENFEENVVYETLKATPGILTATPDVDGTLVTDVYNGANPAIVTADGVTMLLYVADDLGRDGLDQTRLVYSLYESASGSYLDPVSVIDDGTADYGHEVFTDGKDIYVTWLDATKTFGNSDDIDMKDYMSAFRVRVARYDKNQNAFVDLGYPQKTNDYTYMPKLAVVNGKLSAAFVENTDNAMFGLSVNNVIHVSAYTGTEWKETDTISGLNSVVALDMGEVTNGKGMALTYAVDKDNDLTTREKDLYHNDGNGKTKLIATANVSSISYTQLPGVSGTVAAANIDGGLYYINGKTLTEVIPEGTMNTDSKFEVSGNSVIYLLSDGEIRNLAVANYDNNGWGTALLTHEDGYVDYFSVAGGKVAYLHSNAAKGSGNIWNVTSDIKLLSSIEYSDTELESADFALSDAYAGADLPVELYIKNNGSRKVNKVNVTVTYDGSELTNEDISVDLKPGEVKPYYCSFEIPEDLSAGGDFTVTAISENDENNDNDSKVISLRKADLEVSAYYDDSGVTSFIGVTVQNRGLIDSNMAATVKDEAGNTLITEKGKVDAGDIYTFKKTISLESKQMLTITVKGDAPEFYESNNTAYIEVGESKEETKPSIEDSFVVRFADTYGDPYSGLSYNSDSERYEAVYTGSAIKPEVVVYDLKGQLKEGVDYSVSYSNNTKVDAKGKPAKVTVTGKGNYTGKKELSFYILPVDFAVAQNKGLLDVTDTITVASGKKASPVIMYRDYMLKASDMDISNKNAITADTTIKVTGKGNFKGTLNDIKVKVIDKKIASKLQIKAKVKAGTHVYDGKSQTLTFATPGKAGEVTVTAGSSKTPLSLGKDFRVVKYTSNVNAGTAKVTIVGIGEYYGTSTVSFKILPNKSSRIVSALELEEGREDVAFTAGGATPEIKVTATLGDETFNLKEGKDYKVSYSANKAVGTGKYSVTFIGNYKGHAALKNNTFKISKGEFTDAEVKAADMLYTKPGKYISTPFVSIDGIKLSAKDYFVTYTDGTNEITAKTKITLGPDEKSRTITVIATGKGNFKAQEVTTTYRIVRRDAEAIDLSKAKIVAKDKVNNKDVAVSKQEYTGRAIKPEIRVLVKEGKNWKEVPESAYKVNYINNIQKGNATIMITGDGKTAVGSKTAKFTISSKNLSLFKLLFR